MRFFHEICQDYPELTRSKRKQIPYNTWLMHKHFSNKQEYSPRWHHERNWKRFRKTKYKQRYCRKQDKKMTLNLLKNSSSWLKEALDYSNCVLKYDLGYFISSGLSDVGLRGGKAGTNARAGVTQSFRDAPGTSYP